LRIARVVGNVVSTVKDRDHYGYKLMIIEYLDGNLKPDGARQVAFDCADAGIGDYVLVNVDGGAANMLLCDNKIIADITICGVLDNITLEGETTAF
jgi:microcompartment protein CcmK/EutM